MLRTLLRHPLTRGLDIDDPRTTELRRRIIREKAFLHSIYLEWYGSLVEALPPDAGPVLEIGSGAGFLDERIPGLFMSDVFHVAGLTAILDAQRLPFASGTLRGLVMTDVLHHVAEPERFLREAARCTRTGGVVAMIEPWVTPWSRFVWGRLHHEPFDPRTDSWTIRGEDPLSCANGALPWILFCRDRARFDERLPYWSVTVTRRFMPFRYVLSGGVSLRALAPGWSFGFWRWLERRMEPWSSFWATYACIVLRRTEVSFPEPGEETAAR